MNKRLKKKEEKKKRQFLHRMLDLALDVNGLEQRQQEISGNLPTAFFEFHGQVAHAEITIFPDGWCYGSKDNGVELTVWLDKPIGLAKKAAIQEMEKYKRGGPKKTNGKGDD